MESTWPARGAPEVDAGADGFARPPGIRPSHLLGTVRGRRRRRGESAVGAATEAKPVVRPARHTRPITITT